ncbi:MAG: hypothetical protein IT561_23485 [Alphaproteobacteria bacterium]|nr:hypothetical protein [Alphaproteobacteria bacterium]
MKAMLLQLARRLAADPRVQEKAKEKATELVARARPKVEAAAAELRAAAREVDPRRDPKGFARLLKQRWDARDRN